MPPCHAPTTAASQICPGRNPASLELHLAVCSLQQAPLGPILHQGAGLCAETEALLASDVCTLHCCYGKATFCQRQHYPLSSKARMHQNNKRNYSAFLPDRLSFTTSVSENAISTNRPTTCMCSFVVQKSPTANSECLSKIQAAYGRRIIPRSRKSQQLSPTQLPGAYRWGSLWSWPTALNNVVVYQARC